MKLSDGQVAALQILLNYVAEDECVDYNGNRNHIYHHIRILYRKVFGEYSLKKLEDVHKLNTKE